MRLLCWTSCSWIRNIIKAFKLKKKTFGILTSISTLASVNLWRDYQYTSTRRAFDVFSARCLGLYYVKYGFFDHPINRYKRLTPFTMTSLFYLLSKYGIKPNLSHFVFHLNVYNSQRILLNI